MDIRKVWRSRMGKGKKGRGKGKGSARMPVPVLAYDDMVRSFRSRLLREERDGSTLAVTLDRMAKVHPDVAERVISAGSLGMVSCSRAVESLRTYARTGVASAPLPL